LAHPRWPPNLPFGPGTSFPNLAERPGVGKKGVPPPARHPENLVNPGQTGDDLRWMRALWPGKGFLRGWPNAGAAELAMQAGCDGVIVSNHGGRQIDQVPGTLQVLPEIVQAVSGRADVLLDGGVRRGSDVVKALSLGAKAVLVGRPWLYGLAAAGERGVS